MSNRKKLRRVQKRKQEKAKAEKQLNKQQQDRAKAESLFTLAASIRKGMEKMWSRPKIEAMETNAIIAKLSEFRIDFDEELFQYHAQNFYSPSDLSDHLWEHECHLIKGIDDDFPWMAAGVLWQRLCPELANCDTIIAGIDEGDELLKDNGSIAACDRWLQVWDDLKSRFLKETKDIETVEERAGDYYSISQWVISVDEELRKAGLDDSSYLQKRIDFCREIVELLPGSYSEFLERMDFGRAESFFMLGDAQAGDAAFQEMLEKYPDKRWLVYASWGDCWTERYGTKIPADLMKAKALYEKAVECAPPEQVESVQERIEELADT